MSQAISCLVTIESVQQKLCAYRISGMAQALSGRLIQARATDCDYLEFLDGLLDDEMDKRRNTLVERRFKFSRMPARQTIDECKIRLKATG